MLTLTLILTQRQEQGAQARHGPRHLKSEGEAMPPIPGREFLQRSAATNDEAA